MESPSRPTAEVVAGLASGGPVTRWRLLAALWAAGGGVGALTGALAGASATTAAGVFAVGLAVMLGALAKQLDDRLQGALIAIGLTVATFACLAAGVAGEPLLLIHLWGAAAAWYFLSPAAAAVSCLYAIGLDGVAMAALPVDDGHAALQWVATATSVVVIGGLTGALRHRADSLEGQLRDRAEHDALTGALNQRGLADRISAGLARQRRTAEPVALVLCDLEDVPVVSEHFGRHAGDALLRRFVADCETELRATDALARVGSERFALLLADADADGATSVVERVRARIAENLRTPDGAPIAVSFGIASAPADAHDVEALLAAADHALEAAVRAGHDRVLRAGTVWPSPR